MNTIKDSRARRDSPRLAGTFKGLSACALAVALMSLAGVAQADVFGTGKTEASSAADSEALRLRMSQLERQFQELKGTGAAPQAAPADAAPAAPSVTETPASLKTYRVVGEVNGRHLVRVGELRFLLTTAELNAFKAEEPLRVSAAAQGNVGRLTLPPPPPLPSARAAAPAPAKDVKESKPKTTSVSSLSKPAAKSGSKATDAAFPSPYTTINK